MLGKEPALVELILGESREVLRAERGVLIVETHHGFVCANAGIDTSNLPEEGTVALLPEDPDASARRIRAEISTASGGEPGEGSSEQQRAGRLPRALPRLSNHRGRDFRQLRPRLAIGAGRGGDRLRGAHPAGRLARSPDTSGRELEATQIAIADEAAAAADLIRDKVSRVPAAIVRGLVRHVSSKDSPGAAALRRLGNEDLFR